MIERSLDVDSLVHILPDEFVCPPIAICGRLLSRCGDAIGADDMAALALENLCDACDALYCSGGGLSSDVVMS